MKLLEQCVLCGSSALEPCSMRFRPGYPHISRVKCKSCSAVFANPMAEERELVDFYQNYYDKGNFQLKHYKNYCQERFDSFGKKDQASLRKEFNYALKYKDSGNFLDVGFGLGEPLFLAHKLGFNIYGTEFDEDAIDFFTRYVPNFKAHHGDLMSAPFPDESFDFIRFWHVIEHVLAPRQYIQKIKTLLKPGGILMIGTPNIENNGYRIYRFLKFMTLSIPEIVEGIDHTVLFNKNTLSKLVEDEGFEIVEHYTHRGVESYKELLLGDLSVWKKYVGFVQTLFHINQTLYARKVE